MASVGSILTLNVGSSSVRAARFSAGTPPGLEARAHVERLGGDRRVAATDHAAAVREAIARLAESPAADTRLVAVAHRVVYGGRFTAPQLITADLAGELEAFASVDPDHMPQALAAIEQTRRRFPDVPQVACFDTAFHARMPHVARTYPLPLRLRTAGLRRYGFHGLSCESVLDALDDPAGRLVIAHLGSGCSLTAVRDGRSVDTTMGFTPAGGVVMGTRSGDLDPGVLVWLVREHGLTADALNRVVNQESGLLGLSETSADMRDLLAREHEDPRAAEAVAVFCYSVTKALGALTGALGGLDRLVFTGGIGEHAAPVRQRVTAGLAAFGIEIDAARNDASVPVISTDRSPVRVHVVGSREEAVLARHAMTVVGLAPGGAR